MPLSHEELFEFLEEKYHRYNHPEFIGSDPIQIPHRFSAKEDIEIAGFLSATIAWGQRPTIIKNANRLMALMDECPADFIRNHQKSDRKRLAGFVHRTFNEEDASYFLEALQHIYLNGGLEKAFAAGFKNGGNAQQAISQFHQTFFDLSTAPARTHKHVANPNRGSSAKRINMFLRWMVRNDKAGVDFGIWKNIDPALLHLPLDVHTGNVARKLGLLSRKQNDWKAVVEVTECLKTFDPKDPVKYDFSLFGLGIFEKF